MTATLDDEVAVLRRRLDEALAERDEVQAQKDAIAEVLEVINGSSGDLSPVFDAMLEKAVGLCDAAYGVLRTFDGKFFHLVAMRGEPDAVVHLKQLGAIDLGSVHADDMLGRIVRGEAVVHIADIRETHTYRDNPVARERAEAANQRTWLAVALRKDAALLGVIMTYRAVVHPFTEKQIALLQNFAAQAVIAMENARLLTETREALEQQTATTEVLQVINSSPGDLAPVFDAMLEKAMRLCEAAFGMIHTFDGTALHLVAQRGIPPLFAEFAADPANQPGPGGATPRLIRDPALRFVHVTDAKEEEAYRSGDPFRRALVDIGGARTMLAIPLRKDGVMVGVINIYRQEVRAYTEKEIAVMGNFAAQAVIAIENARLLTETRESLEQQTATAEVLQVINSSPGDLTPVFDAILEKAHSLCGVSYGSLQLYDGEKFRAVAVHGLPGVLADRLRDGYSPGPTNPVMRLLKGERFVHTPDLAEIDDPITNSVVDLLGTRTLLCVALRKDKKLLGLIAAVRLEVRPFADKQIALLENFAAQAVIAMENARLITETREALEQQTATAEVLQVINSSPGDLVPVFDAILEKAHRLCGAANGSLQLYDGQQFRAAAVHGFAEQVADRLRRGYRPGPNMPNVLDGAPFAQIPDLMEIDDPAARDGVELGGIRTVLAVALRRDTALLGQIVAARLEVRPFAEKEIARLQNFAAQAVIAIENARLITETREALEQQTATAEVLGVINSSPGDLGPVFDAMLDKAMRLSDSVYGHLLTYDGEFFDRVAVRGNTRMVERQSLRRRAESGITLQRIVRGESVVQIVDVMDTDAYRSGNLAARVMVDEGDCRTLLTVALRKEDILLGTLSVYRRGVQPFTDKQIALLQNFAAQAVIAMENARLITETREALEQQTATAEVLQVINSSPGDLTPVFDAILEKAHALCGATHGALGTYDDDYYFRSVVARGYPQLLAERLQQGFDGLTNPVTRPLIDGAHFVHIPDLAEIDHPIPQAVANLGGFHTGLFLPLRKDDRLLGHISATRSEVRPFAEKEIALLQNFAAQAVIAMENGRLITETREALEQQTATAEVLQVINSSPGDLAPVFDAMLEKAMGLCEASFGGLSTYDGEKFYAVATRGLPPALVDFFRNPYSVSPQSYFGQIVSGETLLHVADLTAESSLDAAPLTRAGVERGRAFVEFGNARTGLFLALQKEGALLGILWFYRQEVRPFSDKQIALLQNFAAQAVIAMENARLLSETNEALEQQTATAEVLQVINSSPGNLQPVFDAMLEKAIRVCDAEAGVLLTYDGECFWPVAHRGLAEFPRDPVRSHPETGSGRIARGEDIVHILDSDSGAPVEAGDAGRLAMLKLGGARTQVAAALRKEGKLLGSFTIWRREVRAFSDKQIALLQNFAAQAVIAMENARLLNEIRQRQAELRVTFDNMVDGVAMFDEELRLAAWNRNLQQMLDLPDVLLSERPSYADYVRILADRGEFGTDDIEAEVSRRLEDTDQELRFERTRPDGRVIEVRRNAVPGGGFVLIYSDITERKRSEAEIHAARDAAETAYRDLKTAQASLIQAEKMASLGQLTAGIAHEIKNPLNFVNNFAGLSVELLDELKETAAPAIEALGDDRRTEIDETIEMLTGNLEKIAEHGKRADNIVKSMLEHSRGSSGERRSVDLNGLIEEALNLAYHGARAQDQNFNTTLERDYAPVMAPIELVPQDITRVCLNLLGNGFYAATKRQKEGSDPKFKPTLKVSSRDLGDVVEIRVRDNGTGIPPEIKDKLFQPFFTTKPTGEGTGLGLSISYDIVTQQHGGTIEVDSRVGEFTEFKVRLPRTHRATMAEAAS